MGNAESNQIITKDFTAAEIPPTRVIDPATYWEELINAVDNSDYEAIQIIASTEGP